jgi:hypothetical protein
MAYEEKPAKPVLSGDFDSLVTDITALVTSLNDQHLQMVLAYTPIVQSIIQSGSQDVDEIEHTLDHLLTCAGHPQGLLLFKSLCRYYYGIDPAAATEYVHFYREWYDDAAAVPPALTFEGEPNLLAHAAKLRGLGYGG